MIFFTRPLTTGSRILLFLFLFTASLHSVASDKAVPNMPGPITGQTNVCAFIGTQQTLRYTIEPVAGAQLYLWTVPSTVTILEGQGTTSITVSFALAFRSAANKQLKVRAISEDGNSPDRVCYLLAQQPGTPDAISGPSNACIYIGTPNAATYSTARDASASSYIWGVPAGAVVTHPNRPGVNDTVIRIVFRNDYKTGQVTVQGANDCGFSLPRVLTVAGSAPSTPGAITGPSNACAYMLPNGTAATYSINSVTGATSYTWTAPAGSIVEHPNGSGNDDIVITVRFPGGFTGGTISVVANSGCDESAPRSLTISKLNPSTPGVISPQVKVICPNREYAYTLPSMPLNTTSVNWTVPPDAIGFSGQGTTTINVLYPEYRLSGTVSATAVSNCASSASRVIAVNLGRCQLERSTAQPSGRNANSVNANHLTFSPAKNIPGNSVPGTEGLVLSISPNPSTAVFKVMPASNSKAPINMRVIDLQGREIRKLTALPNEQITFGADLKPGTYVLEAVQGLRKVSERIVKL